MDIEDTTTTNSFTASITLKSVLEAKKLLGDIPKDPFVEYMRKNGFDPDKGDYLVIPEKIAREVFGGYYSIPAYVKPTKMTKGILMVKGFKWSVEDLKLTCTYNTMHLAARITLPDPVE
ncbi:MAG: hypothetical protein GY928_34640 [Colwellia sp.]|nr:hypothetical protein [Colwellia sp.]